MPKLIDHAVRRAEYAEATWRVIESRGIAEASVRNVAAEAGVSAGSLRHLFPTQSSLVAFAMTLVVDRIEARVRAVQPTDDPIENAANLLSQLLPLDEDRRVEARVWLAFSAAAAADERLAEVRQRQFQALANLCAQLIGDLASLGKVRDDTDLTFEARRLHALVDGLAIHATTEDIDWSRQVLDQHLLALHPSYVESPR